MILSTVGAIISLLILRVVSATEFSSEPVTSAEASSLTSTAARSDTDCVIKCESSGSGSCSAAAFVPESKVCLAAAARNADFPPALLGSGVVYRRRETEVRYDKNVLAQVGNRTFRIIQQRSNGSLSFARKWTEYERGFGDNTDFWIGLLTMNELTGDTPRLIRVETVTWSNVLYVCEYSAFTVGNASTSYTMNFGSYLNASSNTSGDSLSYHKGMKFSTMDRDNDLHPNFCSRDIDGNGGWWYNSCSLCNPTGVYYTSAVANGEIGMNWFYATGNRESLKSIRLMLLV